MLEHIVLPHLRPRGLKIKPLCEDAHCILRPSGDNINALLYELINSLNLPEKGKPLLAKFLLNL